MGNICKIWSTCRSEHHGQRAMDVLDPVVSPTAEGGQIHLHPLAIQLTQTVRFD